MSDNKNSKCILNYANKCECREDDNCGCTFPNNCKQDFYCPDNDCEKNNEKNDKTEDDERPPNSAGFLLICTDESCQYINFDNLDNSALPEFDCNDDNCTVC